MCAFNWRALTTCNRFIFGLLFETTHIMKTWAAIFALMLMLPLAGEAQKNHPPVVSLDTLQRITQLPVVTQNAFKPGEKLAYRVRYGFIQAGEISIEVKPTSRMFSGRKAHHIVGVGQTIRAFSWFYKMRDRYDSYIDAEGLFPWEFERDLKESNYASHKKYRFYPDRGAVETSKGQTYATPHGVQDMISAFYYARTFDFSRAKPGDVFSVESFMDEEIFNLQVKFLGRETIKTKKGTFRCLKFVPHVQEGRVFKKEESVVIWISDDANKIPVLAQADIVVGSIKIELEDYQGIANPLAMY